MTTRVSIHPHLWLESRKGMTAKKRRPRHSAVIDPDHCTGCLACLEVCPTDCIEDVDVAEVGLSGHGRVCEVRIDDCIDCVQCQRICPWEAIAMVDTATVEAACGRPPGSL